MTSDASNELSDTNAEENTLNSSTCTARYESDGINGDQDETSQQQEDEEMNDISEAVTG